MKVEKRKVGNIRPYEGNPRQNDDAVDAVAASIHEFGFQQPIVVDTDGVIVVGHTRWKAAKKLGLEFVSVHVATDLTPEQAKAYRLADNRVADLATWDYDLLPIELRDLHRRHRRQTLPTVVRQAAGPDAGADSLHRLRSVAAATAHRADHQDAARRRSHAAAGGLLRAGGVRGRQAGAGRGAPGVGLPDGRVR